MRTKLDGTKTKKRASIAGAVLLTTAILAPVGHAADAPLTGRISLHYTKSETIEVGDAPGHLMGVAQQTGLVFYADGGVARKTTTFTFDLVKGKGTFNEYSVITDQDGSILVSRGIGTAGPVGDGKKFVIEGKIECIGGTGRYEGFKGTGTFTGERIGELKTGGDAFFDFSMNCGKP